jgi:hypothetical protein
LFTKIFGRFRDDRLAAARRGNNSAAARIGATEGELVRSEQTGGRWLDGPPGLVVVTIRPGRPDDVLHALIDSAVAAGYPRPPRPARGYEGACLFPTAEGLSKLHVEVIPPRHRFRVADRTVPDGHTGVVVSLHTPLKAR